MDIFHDGLYQDFRHNFEDMNRYLTEGHAGIPPPGLVDELLYRTEKLEHEAMGLGDLSGARYLHNIHNQIIKNKDNSSRLIRIIESILNPYSHTTSRTNSRLETKLANLEDEIVRLSSNPEFEEKMSKLEAELESIRSLQQNLAKPRADSTLDKKVADLEKQMQTFLISNEDGEKKFEDMLASYKKAKTKVFVIMPFANAFDDVWRGGIERACKPTDTYGALRVDEIRLSTWITEDIKEYISMADVVIADITGSNPNVMFELGWALAIKKELIVIRQQDDPVKVAFDVHGIRHLPYITTWSGIERLHREICKYLKATEEVIASKNAKK